MELHYQLLQLDDQQVQAEEVVVVVVVLRDLELGALRPKRNRHGRCYRPHLGSPPRHSGDHQH